MTVFAQRKHDERTLVVLQLVAGAVGRKLGDSQSEYMFELQRRTLAESLNSLSRVTKARCEIPPVFGCCFF